MVVLNGRDIILTGVPRAGTTLACQLIHQCDGSVALFEPMDMTALHYGDRQAAIAGVQRFFVDARKQLLAEGTAPSMQVDGGIPDNSFASAMDTSGHRRLLASPGLIRVEPKPQAGFTLVVKHNASFTALLPELAANLETLAIVRHPLSVLASWNSVELPVREGRVPAGERLDPLLATRLDGEQSRIGRQLIVLEWFFDRFARFLTRADILRYEDIIATQGQALLTRAGLCGQSLPQLTERNASLLYPRGEIPMLANALCSRGGSWERWYPSASIAPLAARMLAALDDD